MQRKRWKLRFSPLASNEERGLLEEGLLTKGEPELVPVHRHHSKVKDFWVLKGGEAALFLKSRRFDRLSRRVGRTVRRTKEQKEFANLHRLFRMGVPCPRPVALCKRFHGPLILESFLAMEHLKEAVSLKAALEKEGQDLNVLLDATFTLFRMLIELGIVHKDLQWNNIMVDLGKKGPKVYIVDALHVLFQRRYDHKPHAEGLSHFVNFLDREGASDRVRSEVLKRVRSLNIP